MSVLVVFGVPLMLLPPAALSQESCQYDYDGEWEYGANTDRQVYYGNIYTDSEMVEEAGGWWPDGKLIELCPDQDKARLVCQSQEASTRQEWGNDPSVVWEVRDGQVGLVLYWAYSPPITDTEPIDWGNCMDPGWYVYRLFVDGQVRKSGWLNSDTPPSVTWFPDKDSDTDPKVWGVEIRRIGYTGNSGYPEWVTPQDGPWNPDDLPDTTTVASGATTTTEPEQITTTTTVAEATTTTAPVTTTTVTTTTTTTTLQDESVVPDTSTTSSKTDITTMPEGSVAGTHRTAEVLIESTDSTHASSGVDYGHERFVVVSGVDNLWESVNSPVFEDRVFVTSTSEVLAPQSQVSSTSTTAVVVLTTLPDPGVVETESGSVSGRVVAGWVLGGLGMLLVLWGLWRTVRAREPGESH